MTMKMNFESIDSIWIIFGAKIQMRKFWMIFKHCVKTCMYLLGFLMAFTFLCQ